MLLSFKLFLVITKALLKKNILSEFGNGKASEWPQNVSSISVRNSS